MGLVSETIEQTVDSSTDLSQILRKAKILAYELGSEELSGWVDAELNGYRDDVDIPDYRVSPGTNFGHFIGLSAQIRNAPLHLSNLPEKVRKSTENLELRGGVAELQEMLRDPKGYRQLWNPDVVALVQNKFFQDYRLVEAWKVIPTARIAYVLDSVRNRLLSFLLDLKKRYPEAASAQADIRSIPRDEMKVMVVNNIYGGTNVVASGGTVHQQAQLGVTPGDMQSLLRALREAAIPDELLGQLKDAIKHDPSERTGGLGPRVTQWLARLAESAVSSATTVAIQALIRYYGIIRS